jgi:hypothetical protein
VTRTFVFRIKQEGDAEKLRQQVREMIVKSLPDEQWEGRLENGQAVLLTVLPDRIVLRHKPAVQKAVQELLKESGVAMRGTVPPEQGRRGMSGGGVDGDGKQGGGLGEKGGGSSTAVNAKN